MSYTPIGWKNYPDKTTPVNADNLNKMEKGIIDAHDMIGDISQILDIGDGTIAGAIAEQNDALVESGGATLLYSAPLSTESVTNATLRDSVDNYKYLCGVFFHGTSGTDIITSSNMIPVPLYKQSKGFLTRFPMSNADVEYARVTMVDSNIINYTCTIGTYKFALYGIK